MRLVHRKVPRSEQIEGRPRGAQRGEPVLPINHNIDDVSSCPESLHLRFRAVGFEEGGRWMISPAELAAYRSQAAPNTLAVVDG